MQETIKIGDPLGTTATSLRDELFAGLAFSPRGDRLAGGLARHFLRPKVSVPNDADPQAIRHSAFVARPTFDSPRTHCAPSETVIMREVASDATPALHTCQRLGTVINVSHSVSTCSRPRFPGMVAPNTSTARE